MSEAKRIGRKKITAILTACTMLIFSACASKQPPENSQQEETAEQAAEQTNSTTQIVIPSSLLTFAGVDLQDSIEEFESYCTSVTTDAGDMVIEVTEEQRSSLINKNIENINSISEEVEAANPEYSCELSSDYSKAVYKYDENIDQTLQAKILVALTTNYALNEILETNNSDWSIDISVVNCHTNNTVAQVTLPEQTITFGQDEWTASYE